MLSWLHALAITAVALFVLAPQLATADCHDADDADCAPECVCVCHAVTVLAHGDSTPTLDAPGPMHFVTVDYTCSGELLPSDIFRPPAAS